MSLSDRHNTQIENQSLHSLECAFRTLVDLEIDYEHKLKMVQEVKARIMIEIDMRINNKSNLKP